MVATQLDHACSGTGIRLTLCNFSLSVVPQPSLVTRFVRKVQLGFNSNRSPGSEVSDPSGGSCANNVTNPSDDLDPFDARTSKSVDNNIFRNVDMSVKPGQVCIILGGSGSGKTSLLNAIAGRISSSGASTSGSIRCNDANINKFWNDGSIGYLQQQDFLMPFLTVRETLNYAADLRLPRAMSRLKRRELVELVLLELGLKECADTRVGDPGGGERGGNSIRGISGGERRRVTAGVQLLTNPKVLLCDEVTSGLDAFSAYETMKSFIKLAYSAQKTIVISIHQPRSEIFNLLSESDGQIVLLSRGDVLYSGPAGSVLSWFESTGVGACPTETNPFDYLLDLSMTDFASPSTENTTAVRRELLVQAWRQRSKNSSLIGPEIEISFLNTSESEISMPAGDAPSSFASLAVDLIPRGTGPSLQSQIRVLTLRGWHNLVRDRLAIWGGVGECIVAGLIIGCIFYRLDESLAGIRSRSSIIYFVGTAQSYLMLMVQIYRLSKEIVVYDRERMDRWYGPLPHVISTCLYSVPLNILYPLVFSTIVYYLAGLRTDSGQHFGWWLLVNVVMQFVTFSFAVLCSSLVRGFPSASLLGNGIFMFFDLSTGFFILSSSIPVWIRWIKYFAYTHTCYNILVSNEFTDRLFACPYAEADGLWDSNKCALWDGNLILKNQMGIEPHYYPGPISKMVFYFIGFLLVAWFALTINIVNPTEMSSGKTLMDHFFSWTARIFLRKKPSPALKTSSSPSGSAVCFNESLDLEKSSIEETRLEVFSKGLERKKPVTIRVEGLSLFVPLSGFKWGFSNVLKGCQREKTEKQLLKDIDVVFPAGELTAILGGSGSGKTSLLNTLLHRMPSSLKMKGTIYYNDTKNPSLRMINGVSSYVRQDDNLLLSHLTVRETLQFAAELRMSSSISRAEKHSKAEDIIDLLGLRECVDVIVGSTAVKGISGGQRRRVSIGIQLLKEPACLFLDEPTSGLDALTAKTIILTLKQIAASGRTVVCTIHQPRADIWHVFDNVVLLVTGGCVAYSGRTDEVIKYFRDAGHTIPPFTNIPDFILDTASVNLRSIESEDRTRAIVNALVDRFNTNKQTMLVSQIPAQSLGELAKVTPHFASFGKAFPVITHRSFVNTFRQKGLYLNRIAQVLSLAILMTIFFAPLGRKPSDVVSRFGLIQETSPFLFAGMLNNVAIYPFERDIAYREISDGDYSATSFVFSFLVNEIPLEIISSLAATVFMMVIAQMRTTVFTFFSFWVVIFGYVNVGESIGLIFSTLVTHVGFNITVVSAILNIFLLMTGIISLNKPQWMRAINQISVLEYGSTILARNEFEDQVFDCSEIDISSGGCPYPTGESVLEMFNFQDKSWDLYMGLFVTVVVVYRLLGWLALVVKTKGNKW